MSGGDESLPAVHKRGAGVTRGNLQKARVVEAMFAGAGQAEERERREQKAEETARARRAHTAHAFDREKDRLVDKYQKKRNKLESRGIFDNDVNTIRAENMLLSALGKVRMQALSKTMVRDVSEFDTRTGAGQAPAGHADKPTARDPRAAAKNANSMASKLETELNKLYERDAHPDAAAKEDAHGRRGGRRGGDRKTVFVGRVAGGRRPSIPSTGQTAPSEKPAHPTPPPGVGTPQAEPAERHESAAAASVSHRGDDAAVHDAIESPLSIAGDAPQDALSQAGLDSPNVRSDASSPAPGEATLSPGRSTRRRRRGVEKDVTFTAAEWMQKQWEHLRYPQVERRLKRRAKRADNQHRPAEYTSRYTEPRQWMSGAAAQKQPDDASPRHGAASPGMDDEDAKQSATHRDNAMRQQWERNAAILSVDSMLYSPSLIEVVDGGLVNNSSKSKKGEPTGHVPVTTTSTVAQQPPRPEHLVYNAGYKGKAALRDVYREENRNELMLHKAVAVHPSIRLHEFEDVPVQSPKLRMADSSSDEDEDEGLPLHMGDGVDPTQRETLELLEGVITFMCKEFSLRRIGRSNQMVHIKVIRNLLIQCLKALVPSVNEPPKDDPMLEAAQDDAKSPANGGARTALLAAGARDHQNRMEHRVALMRSWSKGVETLLTWDLGLGGPYQQGNPEHLTEFAKYYTGLKKKINQRCHALMQRWRSKAEDLEAESSQRNAAQRNTEHEEKRAEISQSLSAFVVDGSNPKTAHHVRLFMEQFGFVPSGPAGAGALPKATHTDKIREILMATHNAEQQLKGVRVEGASRSTSPAVSPTLRSQDGTDVGQLTHESLYHGAKLPDRRLYTVGVQFANVFRHKATASLVEPGSQLAQRVGSPFPRGTVVVVIAEQKEWVQLENGYWMLAQDLVAAEGACGEVLQHSADNAKMRKIVGAKESRQRQHALILNSLLSVLHAYLRLTSKETQEEFVAIARDVARRPVMIEDEAKLDRLFSYDSDRETDETSHATKEAQREMMLKEQHHQVMRDMLLKKYGQGKSHIHRLQQQYIKNTTVWSTSLDAQIKMAFSYQEQLAGSKGDAAKSDGSDVEIPSIASSDSDDPVPTDEKEASDLSARMMAELNGILQQLNWEFQLRHDTSNRWSSLPVDVLKKTLKHWKRGGNHYQAHHMAMMSLVKRLETDPSVVDEPEEMSSLCQNVVQLGKALEIAAIKLRQALRGEEFLVEGLQVDAYLRREAEVLKAALRSAKNTPAAKVAEHYFDTVRGPPVYRSGVGV